ncbi:MAG: FHA domain-containing protein [Anaerolineae bacterium]|jgi:hypothetical protein
MSIGQLVEVHTGQIHSLGIQPLTVGRHEDADIVLTDPQVSRQHAEIAMQGGKWVIRDLGSANGTFVNGQRLAGLYVLESNDIVEVGQTRFRFEMMTDLAEQDTLVDRLPIPAAAGGQREIPWLTLGLAVAVVAIIVLFGLFVVWPAIESGDQIVQGPAGTTGAPTQASPAVEASSAAPTDMPQPANPTSTAIPTIAPPTQEPTISPPTLAPTNTPVPAPTIGTFDASQTTITEGECVRLAWRDVENAGRVVLSDVGPVGPSGKVDVCLSATRTYTLLARGPGGTTEAEVEIEVLPPEGPLIEYFRVVPSIVSPGACADLEWGKVENAISAVIEPDLGGVATPGNQQVCPGETTTYVLTAEDETGTSEAETTLIVSTGAEPKPVIAYFTANPASIQAAECTTLDWGKVDYATAVRIDNNIGGVATPGSQEVCLAATTTFVMTAEGAGGLTERELTVAVSPGPQEALPDLVLESILFEPNPCYRAQTCKVRIKVRNDGPVAAQHFVVRWAPEGEEVVPVGWDMDGLGSDQEITLTYNWIPNRINENWRTMALVDENNEVSEIEEGAANALEQFITVLEP